MSWRLEFTAEDISQIRFVFSPLWECVMSLRVLQDPALAALHLPWVRETRNLLELHKPKLNLETLFALVKVPKYMPDFLTPPPITPFPDFESELEQMRQTPIKTVKTEIARTFQGMTRPRIIQDFLLAPETNLIDLAQTLQAYWTLCLAPHWTKIRMMLELDVITRARKLVLGGAEELFSDLHGSVTFKNNTLTKEILDTEMKTIPSGRGLVLVPSMFCWSRVMTLEDPNVQPMLVYPALGVANLWFEIPKPTNALEKLLGASCARVLTALKAPNTTLSLAKQFKLAAGGISLQLAKLRDAGLIESERQGREVYYRLSSNGEAFLALLEPS
jgi:DNA-binding transcriptional ArsR family regulator